MTVKINEKYLHTKSQVTYTVLGISKPNEKHSRVVLYRDIQHTEIATCLVNIYEGLEHDPNQAVDQLVIYQSDGPLWVRPITIFEDGRFQLVGVDMLTSEKSPEELRSERFKKN